MQSGQPEYRIGMTVSACVWLGLFPLLQGSTYSRLTVHKFMIMLVLCAFTFLIFLAEQLPFLRCRTVRVPKCRKTVLLSLLPFIVASALLLWTVLSCLFSGCGPETWWLGEAARYEGLLTEICYFILFACFFFSRVRLRPVLLSAAAGVAACFAVIMLQRGGANPLGLYPSGRSYALNPEFQGTIGNVDMGTGYLLLMAGLFLYALIDFFSASHPSRSSRKSLCIMHCALCIVYLLALAITVWLLLTMDVQFGIISLSVLSLFTLLRFLPKKWRLPLLILVIAAVLLAVWFWPGESGGIWELHEILQGRGRLSFGSNRVAVWLYSIGLARENLLFGGGSGSFGSRFSRYLSDNSLVIPQDQDGMILPDYFDNPHNEYVAQLTDHGLPALILFLVLLLCALFRSREGWFPLLGPCSAAVLCYAVQAFFSFSVCIVAPVFWVILGLSFSCPSVMSEKQEYSLEFGLTGRI